MTANISGIGIFLQRRRIPTDRIATYVKRGSPRHAGRNREAKERSAAAAFLCSVFSVLLA